MIAHKCNTLPLLVSAFFSPTSFLSVPSLLNHPVFHSLSFYFLIAGQVLSFVSISILNITLFGSSVLPSFQFASCSTRPAGRDVNNNFNLLPSPNLSLNQLFQNNMRYSLVAAAVLLGSGLAAPHNKEHDQYDSKLQPCKRHDKDCELSFKGTAYPVAISGTPIGPGGPVVTGSQILDEARYYTTEHYFVTSTIKSEDHGSSASPSETPPDMPPPVANKHAVSNGNTEGSRNGDQCKAATVTVTNQITSTVTVAPGATPASSVNASPSNVNVASGKLVTNEGPDAPETEGKSEDTSSQPSASSSPSQSASPETGGDNSDNKQSSPSSSSAASSSPSDTTKPTTNDAPAQAGLPFRTKRGVICSGDTTNQLAGALAEGKISWSGNW